MKKLITISMASALMMYNAFAQSDISYSDHKTVVNSESSGAPIPTSPASIVKENKSLTKSTAVKSDSPDEKSLPDGFMLQGIRMVMVKDGIATPMTKDVVLSNGTKIRKDGYIHRANKYKLLLNSDEYVDYSGKILPINKSNSLK